MEKFDSGRIDWFREKSLDRAGRIFRYDGRYYRGIFESQVEPIRTILGLPSFRQLVAEKLIPPTQETRYKVDGFGLVIQTQTSPFEATLPWVPPEIVRDMALAWIRINQRLADDGYSLIDGHIANFALFGPYPQWIDIGSIQPEPLSMAAVGQFGQCMLAPLLVMGHDPVLRRVGRLLLGAGLVTAAEVRALTGRSFHSGETEPLRVLAWMEQQIRALRFDPLPTPWGTYTKPEDLEGILAEPLDEQPDERASAFNRFVTAVTPVKAIDLGSAGGKFAVRLARRGIPCVAIDNDETALSMLYGFARKKALPITVQLRDIFHFVRHSPRPTGADFVSAMALTHHLGITQGTRFDDMARIFADLTSHALVTEFMPWGLGLNGPDRPVPDPLPDWYRLEVLCEALSRYFRHVEPILPQSFEYSRRQMVLCRDRI